MKVRNNSPTLERNTMTLNCSWSYIFAQNAELCRYLTLLLTGLGHWFSAILLYVQWVRLTGMGYKPCICIFIIWLITEASDIHCSGCIEFKYLRLVSNLSTAFDESDLCHCHLQSPCWSTIKGWGLNRLCLSLLPWEMCTGRQSGHELALLTCTLLCRGMLQMSSYFEVTYMSTQTIYSGTSAPHIWPNKHGLSFIVQVMVANVARFNRLILAFHNQNSSQTSIHTMS